jgi:hypothetical protein
MPAVAHVASVLVSVSLFDMLIPFLEHPKETAAREQTV